MPSIKHWCHLSQDLNRDPEFRAFAKKFGLGGVRFWLEVLAILDRTDNYWDLHRGFDLGLLAGSCETKRHIIQGSVEHLTNIKWLRLGVNIDHMLFYYAPNWAKYNKKREDKGSMADTSREDEKLHPTPTPIPPPTPKKKETHLQKDEQRKNGASAPHRDQDLAEKPEDVDEQVWKDFMKQRKAKHAPFTATALHKTKLAAEKVGYTLEEALALCCQRGWQGFESRYVTPKGEEFI